MSKRNVSGKIISSGPSISTLGLECLPLSPTQLRNLWDYDNLCGNQIMGAPLRSCSCKESSSQDNSNSRISTSEFELLKLSVKDMWNRAKTLFEVFTDKKHPELGYRLRVAERMPIKVTLREEDAFYFGWCAVVPQNSPCAHLYDRSPVQPSGYLGGPASFCNWAVGKHATVSLSRPTSRSTRYLVRLECRNLKKGQELAWNYGCQKEMPIQANWFKECCSVLQEDKNTQRQKKRQTLIPFINVESCVLCGKQFSIKNKECRVQRKTHFVNNHADFLGSSWNGLGPYKQEEVNSSSVLEEADKLNALLQALSKELKWNVIPACNVISTTEKDDYDDPQEVLIEFKKRCALLRSAGTLVLRGVDVALTIEDLNIDHLRPITTSVWRTLKWKNKERPPTGHYSVPNKDSDKHAAAVESFILNFCCKHFS